MIRVGLLAPFVLAIGAAALPAWSQTAGRSDELILQTLQLHPDLRSGKRTFLKLCSSCHGRNARGNAEDSVPALAGQHPSYLIKQLADFAELERDVPEMHRTFANPRVSQPQQFIDLAAFLNGLKPNRSPQHGSGNALPMGGRVYDAACAECHGDSGEGSEGVFVPMLRGQHYSYLLLQMRKLATGHRYNTAPEVMTLLDSLSAEQMAAVADFITRLTPPEKPGSGSR